jgi:hypothetical protein
VTGSNDTLVRAYARLAEQVPPLADAPRAVRTARRQRATLAVAAPATAGVLAVVSIAVVADHTADDSGPPPSTHETTRQDDNRGSDVGLTAAGPEGGLLYRVCDDGGCRVGSVDAASSASYEVNIRQDVAERLQRQGFDGVTMSYEGNWIGIPDGSAYRLYSLERWVDDVTVPAGPEGTRWMPLYWSRDYAQLVLVQLRDRQPTAYAIATVGYTQPDNLRVIVTPAPAGPTLVPLSIGGAYYDMFAVAEPIDTSASPPDRPRLSSFTYRNLFADTTSIESPGLQPPGPRSTFGLERCMRSDETIAGPLGVPVILAAAHDTSTDQAGSMIAFAPRDGTLTPSAVIRSGRCDSVFTQPIGERRYDLPQSDAQTTWTYLGQVDQRRSLMSRQAEGSDTADLVSIGLDGPPTVVGHVPADADLLMAGMTYGLLDFD